MMRADRRALSFAGLPGDLLQPGSLRWLGFVVGA
jgi:hypothetical protein